MAQKNYFGKYINHMRKSLWWHLAEKIEKQNCICHRITKTCSQKERTAAGGEKKTSKTFTPVVWGSGARCNLSAFPWFVSVLLTKFLKNTHACAVRQQPKTGGRLPTQCTAPGHCDVGCQDVSYTASSEGQYSFLQSKKFLLDCYFTSDTGW